MSEPGTSEQIDVNARRAARLGAVQALYQMDLGGTLSEDVIDEFITHRLGQEIEGTQYPEADVDHFSFLIRGAVEEQAKIDRMIEDCLVTGWTMTRLDSTLRALLRTACFELMACEDVPVRSVINEYVEVAHAFFEGDEPKFVNGVVDNLAKALRPTDMKKQ